MVDAHMKCRNSHCICGLKFTKWGLGFFIFGILLSFGIFLNYLKNMENGTDTLTFFWFHSPLSLNVLLLQIGGLGMAAIGSAKIWLSKLHDAANCQTAVVEDTHRHGRGSLAFCVVGLLALFITGYIGYFVLNRLYPASGKEIWVVLQGLSWLCYFIGTLGAFCCMCKCCKSSQHCHTKV